MEKGSPAATDAMRTAMEPRRLEILELIWEQDLSVKEIASRLPVSVAAVSQHLAKLHHAGLVERRAKGRRRYYRARKAEMGALAGALQALWEGPARDSHRRREDAPAAAPTPLETSPDPRAPPPEAPPRRPPPVPRPSEEEADNMTPWYRQGLHARVAALEATRRLLRTGLPGAAASVRRLARSLTRPAIAQRFPETAAAARAVKSQPDDHLEMGLDQLIGAVRQATTRDDPSVVKILVVEDNRLEAILHRAAVGGPNREILLAETVPEAREILEAEQVDLIVLDLSLPGADGRDLLLDLGARPGTASIPVILLTGLTDAQARTEAVSLGADAYYTKPVDRSVLSAAVGMMLERSAEARQIGRRDPLTGLRNRTVFLDEVRQLAASAIRARIKLSLAILDVERLSVVNDRHGSEAGDRVMQAVAHNLRVTLRESDLIGRWGGSKFAVVLPNADEAGATVALRKLAEVTDAARVVLEDGTELPTAWHAGVAPIEGSATVDDAVARATRRLQLARRGRVGRIVSTDASAASGVHTVLLIEDDEILADLITHRLTREGLRVAHFTDGAEALSMIGQIDASAVVLDTMLPGAEGFEVLRRLRESPAFAGVPVVVLTFGSEHDAARAFKLGARDSMVKPFSVEELVARVARLVAEFETDFTE